MWTLMGTAFVWVVLLGTHAAIGWRMRSRAKPSTVFKTARNQSLIAAGIVAPLLLVPGYNWAMGLAVVVGPWVGVLVATFPARKKRMGEPPSETMRIAQEAIVIVECGNAMGNGFWIAPNRLLTSFHILAADLGGRLRAHTINGPIDLNVVNIDPISDLALLEPIGKSQAASVLKLAERSNDLQEGDAVVHASYSNPSQLRPQWREATGKFKARGTVFQLLAAMEHEDFTSLIGVGREAISLELVTEHGHSGSPVMNKNHEVIGILMAGRSDEKVSLVMPVESIHEIMQSR